MRQPTVLIVDDDIRLLCSLQKMAENLGYDVRCATSGRQAANLLIGSNTGKFDAIVSDTRMERGDGIELLQTVNRLPKPPPTLVHSSEASYRINGDLVNLDQYVTTYFGMFAHFATKHNGCKSARTFLEDVLDQVSGSSVIEDTSDEEDDMIDILDLRLRGDNIFNRKRRKPKK